MGSDCSRTGIVVADREGTTMGSVVWSKLITSRSIVLLSAVLPQAIHQTVQKTLKQLRTDCVLIDNTIQQKLQQDAANRQLNHSRTMNAVALIAFTLLVSLLLVLAFAARTAGAVCSHDGGSSGGLLCSSGLLQSLLTWDEALEGAFTTVVGGLVLMLLAFGGGASFAWRGAPVLGKRQHKRLEEYSAMVHRAKQQAEALWEEYFATIAEVGDR